MLWARSSILSFLQQTREVELGGGYVIGCELRGSGSIRTQASSVLAVKLISQGVPVLSGSPPSYSLAALTGLL